jgi:hypothetical protein
VVHAVLLDRLLPNVMIEAPHDGDAVSAVELDSVTDPSGGV